MTLSVQRTQFRHNLGYGACARQHVEMAVTDIARITPRLPVPGRSVWWIVGALAVGIALPAVFGVATALVAYYPIGSALPESLLFARTGTVILVMFLSVAFVVAGAVYAVLARSWRPLFLAAILGGVMMPGFYTAMVSHLATRSLAFHLLADRSARLVTAIEMYARDIGNPPKALSDLVPRYLDEIPRTGMPAYPQYAYQTGPGYCEKDSPWSVSIIAGDVLNWDVFFYCPNNDYSSDIGGNPVELIGDWAYMHE